MHLLFSIILPNDGKFHCVLFVLLLLSFASKLVRVVSIVFVWSLLRNKPCKIDKSYRFGKLGVSAFISAFQKYHTIDIRCCVVLWLFRSRNSLINKYKQNLKHCILQIMISSRVTVEIPKEVRIRKADSLSFRFRVSKVSHDRYSLLCGLIMSIQKFFVE